MKGYIERILHQDIQLDDYKGDEKLPIVYRNACRLYVMRVGGHECILAAPPEDMNLTDLRKQQKMIERYTGYYCALYLKKMNYYAKDKMVEEGIPFIWEKHQVYLPFLGILLNEHDGRSPRACSRISFLTQKLLLTALYEGWKNITVTEAAKRMNVSKMSITRCFDEIQAFEIPYLTVRSRARRFTADENKRKMWESIKPILRDPVVAEFKLKNMISGEHPFAGISALAEYSLLSGGKCPVYAVAKSDIGKLNISGKDITVVDEEPACVVQELGYILRYGNYNAIDPLSVVLSLSESELEDPRVQLSVDEMLEEYVW